MNHLEARSRSVAGPEQLQAAPVWSGWGKSCSEQQQEHQRQLETSRMARLTQSMEECRECHTGVGQLLWLLQHPLQVGKWQMRGTYSSVMWHRRDLAAAQGAHSSSLLPSEHPASAGAPEMSRQKPPALCLEPDQNKGHWK